MNIVGRDRSLRDQALSASREILESVIREGLLSPQEQHARGRRTFGSSDETPSSNPFLSCNVLDVGLPEANRRIAHEAIYHQVKGSLQVIMERDHDDTLGLMTKSQPDLERI
jgi:hypothetical protein